MGLVADISAGWFHSFPRAGLGRTRSSADRRTGSGALGRPGGRCSPTWEWYWWWRRSIRRRRKRSRMIRSRFSWWWWWLLLGLLFLYCVLAIRYSPSDCCPLPLLFATGRHWCLSRCLCQLGSTRTNLDHQPMDPWKQRQKYHPQDMTRLEHGFGGINWWNFRWKVC